ncbi:MAG: threonine/serine exporter family protein [Clostridia bacterium]|nr:threonine/serine exporter family protein [Clostridia bacterium]
MERIITENVETPDSINYERILSIAISVGKGLLSSGSSVSRVETAVERICLSYAAKEVDVWVVPSMLTATIVAPSGEYFSQNRRIYSSANDLGKMEKFNQLSRDICELRPPEYLAEDYIAALEAEKRKPLWFPSLMSGFAAAAFCMLFGGIWIDALVAFPVGMLMGFVNTCLSIKSFNGYVRSFVLAFMGGICSILLSRAMIEILAAAGSPLICQTPYVMIGTTMLIAPGLLVCNAVRDLFVGDLLSGTLQILNGILIILAVAAGYAAAMLICDGLAVYEVEEALMGTMKYVYGFMACVLAVFSYSLIFGMPLGKKLIYAICATVVAYLAFVLYRDLVGYESANIFIANLIVAVLGATAAEILARLTKAPSTMYCTPFLVIFVPGGALYYTMQYLIQSDMSRAGEYGMQALLIFLGIAVGLSVVSVIFQLIRPTKRRHLTRVRIFNGKKTDKH